MLQKQLPPLPIPENLDDLKLQNEAFLQELQNHFAGKSSKSSSPVSQAAALLGSPTSLMPFLPYLQHPYAPLPTESPTPWNVPQAYADDGETSVKKTAMSGFVDTPLNLSKPKSVEESHRSSIKMVSNDGNNNTSKNHSAEHMASGSKMMAGSPRLPYNMPFNSEENDLFAACRLWPAMAAAAQHHHHNNSTSQSNNLTNMMTGNHRDLINENNFANFTQAMAETSAKNKRGGDQMGMNQTNVNDEKVRVVRQQGRGRNSADRDLLTKQ